MSEPGVGDLRAPEVQDAKAGESFDVSEPGVGDGRGLPQIQLFKLGELSDVGQFGVGIAGPLETVVIVSK